MLFVNDYIRAMWIYMLKFKDQALDVFKTFWAIVERQKERQIKVPRTDRRAEFTSNQFVDEVGKDGIMRQFTAPYAPQENGVVERRKRTVVTMV